MGKKREAKTTSRIDRLETQVILEGRAINELNRRIDNLVKLVAEYTKELDDKRDKSDKRDAR